jgi:hypothetical protein
MNYNIENTHQTADNFYSFFYAFFVILSSLFAGFTFGIVIIANLAYPNCTKLECDKLECDKADSIQYGIKYGIKYAKEFNALEPRVLSTSDLSALKFKNVKEEVVVDEEEGTKKEIIMTYNSQTESFWYYTDSVTKISYTMLEMVARSFVVAYNCKAIYIGTPVSSEEDLTDEEGLTDDEEEDLTDDEEVLTDEEFSQKDLIQEQEEIVPSQPKSIFARFKTYNNIDEKPVSSSAANTNAANSNAANANSNAEVKKNQFKYKGKIADAYLKDACAYSSATAESVRSASQTDESVAQGQETGAQGQESGAQAKSLQEPKIDYLSFKKQYILNKI